MRSVNKRRVNPEGESYPFLIYKRIAFLSSTEYANYKLENGYDYLIKRVTAKWSRYGEKAAPALQAPQINIKMFTGGASIAHQQLPVDLALITSPSGDAVFFDGAIASRPLKAAPRKLHKTLNIPCLAYDVIQLEVSGAAINSAVNPDLNYPAYMDLLIEGRYFPKG